MPFERTGKIGQINKTAVLGNFTNIFIKVNQLFFGMIDFQLNDISIG